MLNRIILLLLVVFLVYMYMMIPLCVVMFGCLVFFKSVLVC